MPDCFLLYTLTNIVSAFLFPKWSSIFDVFLLTNFCHFNPYKLEAHYLICSPDKLNVFSYTNEPSRFVFLWVILFYNFLFFLLDFERYSSVRTSWLVFGCGTLGTVTSQGWGYQFRLLWVITSHQTALVIPLSMEYGIHLLYNLIFYPVNKFWFVTILLK